MSVCDCEDGKRLLKDAAQSSPGSVARENFLQHIKQCPVCNAGGTEDCIDPETPSLPPGVIATKSKQYKGPVPGGLGSTSINSPENSN
jgi:hypothetical protein